LLDMSVIFRRLSDCTIFICIEGLRKNIGICVS